MPHLAGFRRRARGRLEMTISVAERDIDAARRLHHLAIWWNESQPIDCFGDRHMSDLIILIADHRPEVSFARQLHGFHPETRRENSIQRRWRTAALQMAKNAAARFFTGASGDLTRHELGNSAEPKFAAFHVLFHLFAMFWPRAFCDDYDRTQITGRLARLDHARDFVEVEWDFGNQDNIGAAGDAAVQCDPAGVAPHYFDHHDAPMTDRRGVQSIERVHHHIDRRIKSEGRRCCFKIVVDGLRDSDAIDTGFLQLLSGHHRPVAAHNDQRLYPKLIEDLFGPGNDFRRHNRPVPCADFRDKMTAIGSPDNRAAEGHDPVDALPIENNMIAGWKKSFESVAKTNDLPTVFLRSEHNSAENSV
jgi:hypothetical protein